MSRTLTADQVREFRRHAAAIRRMTRRPRPNGWSARSREALQAHHDECAQLTADVEPDVAFALDSEHNYLRRAENYTRDETGRRWLAQRLAVVRRVIRKATR